METRNGPTLAKEVASEVLQTELNEESKCEYRRCPQQRWPRDGTINGNRGYQELNDDLEQNSEIEQSNNGWPDQRKLLHHMSL
jgi:hypothetical protein